MEFTIETAKRSQAKLRISLAGPSGSGKTYSALQLAHGMTNDWNKIGVIDTEQHSSSLYADVGPFKIINLTPPFTPERYLAALNAFEQAGMEVVIIDSITHVWNGEGGLLEYNTSLGGRFQDWAKTTPRYQKLIQGILQSPVHVIPTIRKKEAYSMTTENGKTKVEKQGMDDEIRGGFNYEMTTALDINIHHLAEPSKDRTKLFMKPDGSTVGFVITADTGKMLKKWAEEGISVPVAAVMAPAPVTPPPQANSKPAAPVTQPPLPTNGEPKPTPHKTDDLGICEVHNVKWEKHGTFISHKNPDGSWCNKPANSPELQKTMAETKKKLGVRKAK